jgi:hypothetical protein
MKTDFPLVVLKSNHSLLTPGLLLTAALFLPAIPALPAQAVPAARVDAATLARYDRNQNGRLDPEEAAVRDADQTKAAAAVAAGPGVAQEEAVQLSPFEVKENNLGYYAANTMSGTRLNTRIEDLASSISVVTKEQMQDFALLDINDIFNYESGTEGTGNYTAFEVVNGLIADQIQDNPQGANRIRGVGAANMAMNNFATSGRVPIDPLNIDAVEISRGPNSNIFGLGEGSGTVNLISSTAALGRSSATAELRIDDLGGWRTSLDVNRPLIKGKLALRLSGVYQHEAYRQKPSGFETRRFNAMLRAQPFPLTSIRASFQSYHGIGTRPNSLTPRDAVSFWKSSGSPTWDPATSIVTVNGVPRQVTYSGANPVGGYPTSLNLVSAFTWPSIFVDGGGIGLWTINRMPVAGATDGPNNSNGALRLLETIAEPVRDGHPLFSTVPGISDRALYDWESINLAGVNSIKDQVETSTVELEQYAFNTDRHKLAFQLAWNREDADRFNRNLVGQATNTGSNYLYVDVNSRLIDGRPNPYYLRTYTGVTFPNVVNNPFLRDTFRGQAAYVLDLTTADHRWLKWLGRHQLLGYGEQRRTESRRLRYRYAMISDHPVYAPAGQPKANNIAPLGPRAAGVYYRYYVGDNQGQNADYAPSGFAPGTYPFTWYDAVANRWVTDQAALGLAATQDGSAGFNSIQNLIKTRGIVLQSAFFQNRVIITLGKRRDENFDKFGQPAVLKANGHEFDYDAMNGWIGDWRKGEGDTVTKGIVVKPFRWLNLHYNESDSFKPDAPALSLMLQPLPNPHSKGKDYGFSLNLWDGKLVFKANKYETAQLQSRYGQGTSLARRALRVDFYQIFGNSDLISMQNQARQWVGADHPTWTAQQVEDQVVKIMGYTPQEVATYWNNDIAETSDLLAKGHEFELHYNPDRFWMVKLNVTQQESIDANLSPNIAAWIAARMPVWTNTIDPRTNTPFFTTRYNNGTGAVGFLQVNVLTPLGLAQATEGKSRPQIREWRANLSSKVQLAKFTEHRWLKNASVGGAVRWEDQGAIGYYGIPVNGDIAAAVAFDAEHPIYDKAHAYFDAFVGYTTRIYGGKVRAKFQLNVRNLQEDGRLQPVGAYPDGRPHTFRIIDPRTFIFTATFDL